MNRELLVTLLTPIICIFTCFRITSQHNAQVIEKIKSSVKGDYSDDLIKSKHILQFCSCLKLLLHTEGCRNYKKTISARTKVTTPVKKKKYIRSLKQRVSNSL